MLQAYYMNEIERAKGGIGNWTLKTYALDMAIDVQNICMNQVCDPQHIVTSLRDKVFDSGQEQLPPPQIGASSLTRAHYIVKNDLISFSPSQGLFTLTDMSHQSRIVSLFPNERCSCPMQKDCYHILAVKLGLGQEVNVDGLKKSYNISKVRKNSRPQKRAKPGRKQPRVGDEDPEPDPLPDHEEIIQEEQEEPLHIYDQDEEMERDINYSRQVWIPASENLSVNLNITDLNIIKDDKDTNGWLNEIIIDSSMEFYKLFIIVCLCYLFHN